MSLFQIDIGALSEQGKGRNVNQDQIFFMSADYEDNTTGIFVVADGVGGCDDGAFASQSAIDIIKKWWDEEYLDHYNEPELLADYVQEIFDRINDYFYNYGNQNNISLATTISILIMNHDQYYIFHCGDSRIYQLGEEFIQLTQDDKVQDPRDGKMKLNNCLSNLLPQTNIASISDQLYEGDSFLLATDGVFKRTDEQTLSYYLNMNIPAQEIAEKLYQNAVNLGEMDDISMIVIKI